MQFVRLTLIMVTLIYLSACSTTKEYHQTFKGSSENWVVELVQEGSDIFRDHKELENQYEIDYRKHEAIKLKYVGIEQDLGQSVVYSHHGGSGSMKASEGEVIGVDEVFTHSGGTSGISHIPKDLEYKPVDNKDHTFEITVRWNGKEEKIQLKYEE